jgi:hypothetical protein
MYQTINNLRSGTSNEEFIHIDKHIYVWTPLREKMNKETSTLEEKTQVDAEAD